MKKEETKKDSMPKDQVVAILEEIRGDFKVFGEGLDDVRRGVKNLEVKFEEMNEKVDKMDIRLGGVEDRLGGVENRLGGVEDRLGSVEEKVDLLVEDMDYVKASIVDIKIETKEINAKLDNKAEKEVTDKHEKRIFKLEKATFATR